ncbi:hypothetical protein Tco_0516489 [Tanacetum coccineum]
MANAILLMLTTSEICSRFALNSQARNFKILYLKKRYSLSLEILDTLYVDYVYLLWEDLVYQVENMNSKKNNDMYYPSFTKVIVDYFMAKDQAIPRNKMFWHYARDDFMFTTIRVISKHQDTQTAATTKGKRLKTSTKAAKPSKKKQPAKTSKAKGADEGTGSKLGVLDVLTYGSDNEQISCMSSDKEDDDEVGLNDNDDNDDDEDNHDDDDDANNQDDDDQEDDGQDDKDQDDVNEQTDSDNDGDDFVHPKLSTQDHEVRHNKEESDEEIQGANVEEEELDEEETNDEDEANELFRDISSVSSGFVSNMLNPSPDTAVSLIPGIVDAYLANKMHEAVKIAVQLQSNRLRDESQAENEDLLNKLDDNIKKIIKDQVKAQVFKILPKNKKTVNEQLKTEVLTRSSNESKTSHNVAANVSKLELKKILIDKMESNKSIHRSDEQKNLYKALDKDEEPFAGSNRGSKRRIAGKELKEPRHTAKNLEEPIHLEIEEGVTEDQPDKETSQLLDWFQKPVKPPTPKHDWNKTLPDAHGPIQPWSSSLAQIEDLHESFNELIDTPLDFSAFVMNRLKVDTLTPELLANVFYKRRIIAVTKLQIVEWHNYKHLDWITVRRDDDKLYKFKEGYFNWLRIQNIEDISVDIQRRIEDLQLGIESYQKKLNLKKLDTYRSDLKRKEAYTAYFNPKGFIYHNKDKKNRLMPIDELHKFSDNTLNDVRTTLDDRLKGIQMKYLPQTHWRQSGKDKAGAMIQAIDKQLKTRRIMRSLEKFVGGRPFDTSAGNPVKEILLKLNLLDHRILKDRGEGTDNANITRNRPKQDKHGHGNEKSAKEPGVFINGQQKSTFGQSLVKHKKPKPSKYHKSP